EVGTAARAHLDLGRDQLADQVRLDVRAGGERLHVLEAVRERERLGIEERELLLDGEGEVGAALVRRLGVREQLLPRAALLLSHRSGEVSPRARAGGRRRPPTTSARRRPPARRGRAPPAPRRGARAARAASTRGRRRRRARTTPGDGGAPGTAPRCPPRPPRVPSAARRAAATRRRPPRPPPCRTPRGRSTAPP